MALLWIIIGATFDFFDGMSARLLHVSSPIGKELDSLADDVTFGVAPATIVFSHLQVMEYPEFLEPMRPWLPYAAFIIAAFSALRLAKFNLDVVFNPAWLTNLSWSVYLVLALILITSYLLVCEMPLFALKFKQWSFKGNEVKYGFAGFAVAILALSVADEGARGFLQGWWIIILMYVFLSAILFMRKK